MNKKIVVIVDVLRTSCLGDLILEECRKQATNLDVVSHTGGLSELVEDLQTKIIFVPISQNYYRDIKHIRSKRKDIFVVSYQETSFWQKAEQYVIGLEQLKKDSVNLSLMFDKETDSYMIIAPEETTYDDGRENIKKAIKGVVEMALLRSHLTFTRSIVKDGKPVDWNSELVPNSLRTVVNYCIEKSAYKPVCGVTAGHFAHKLNDCTFLTSIRKTDFNKLSEVGLVRVETDGPDTVLAYGAKPSVGGQSQRIVFSDHEDCDCIVHFHVPLNSDSKIPTVSQREFECGSHECGNNTSKGLQKFGNLKAVYLDNHGPNIVFHHTIDPQEVIDFIESNFDLSKKTGGYI